jgi:hypothetical protein
LLVSSNKRMKLTKRAFLEVGPPWRADGGPRAFTGVVDVGGADLSP